MGVPVARIELINGIGMRSINAYSNLPIPRVRACSWNSTARKAGVKEQAETFGELADEFGGGPFHWTEVAEERAKLWKAAPRRLLGRARPQARRQGDTPPMCACRSRNCRNCIVETEADIKEAGLIAPIVGHVGDGQLPCDDPGRYRKCCARSEAAEAFVARLKHAGRSPWKAPAPASMASDRARWRFWISRQAPGIDYMRAIKQALDPKGILNPGKLAGAGRALRLKTAVRGRNRHFIDMLMWIEWLSYQGVEAGEGIWPDYSSPLAGSSYWR